MRKVEEALGVSHAGQARQFDNKQNRLTFLYDDVCKISINTYNANCGISLIVF